MSGQVCAETFDVVLQFPIGILQKILLDPTHVGRDKLPLALMTDEPNPVRRGCYRNSDDCDERERSDRNDVQETTNALRLARIDFVDVVVNFYSVPCCRSRILRDDLVTNGDIILATFTLDAPRLLFFRCSPFSCVNKQQE